MTQHQADIVAFPGAAEKRVRSLPQVNYELDRLAEASEALAAAQLDTAAAIRWVRSGKLMTADNAIMNGETLHSALNAAVALARLMGSRAQDRDMLLAVEGWIEKRETQG